MGVRIYRFILPTGKYKSFIHLEMIFVSMKPCCHFTVEWAFLLRCTCAALQFLHLSSAGCFITTFACTEGKQPYRGKDYLSVYQCSVPLKIFLTNSPNLMKREIYNLKHLDQPFPKLTWRPSPLVFTQTSCSVLFIDINITLYASAYYYYMALHPFVGPGRLFSFIILYTFGRTPWTGDRPVAWPLPTHRTTQKHNKCIQTSVPWVRLETRTPVFERVKMVHDILLLTLTKS
jgi:hypothetical protein